MIAFNKNYVIALLASVIIAIITVVNFCVMLVGGYSKVWHKISNPEYVARKEKDLFYVARIEHLKSLQINSESIIMAGDSLTYNCEWHEMLQNKNVVNRGIGYETSHGLLSRIEEYLGNKPHKIFVMVGVNDILNGETAIRILDNIKGIVYKIKTLSPATEIYIQSVLPCSASFGINHKISFLNSEILKLSAKYGITYVNLYSNFIDKNEQIINEYFIADGLHLTTIGYNTWALHISKYL